MSKTLKAISFVAFAAATHAGVSTIGLTLIPNLYPTPELTARVQHLVFLEASIAFAVMLACYIIARRTQEPKP